MRHSCQCVVPNEHITPSKKGWCVICGKRLDPAWHSSDRNVRAFFDRLEESLPGMVEGFESFRTECMARERAGRDRFGHRYLDRCNSIEAMEEAADGAIYMMLDTLKAIREGGSDSDIDMALTVAAHFAQAHYGAQVLRAKRRGDTGPAMDDELQLRAKVAE